MPSIVADGLGLLLCAVWSVAILVFVTRMFEDLEFKVVDAVLIILFVATFVFSIVGFLILTIAAFQYLHRYSMIF